jgi:hypothetical protein
LQTEISKIEINYSQNIVFVTTLFGSPSLFAQYKRCITKNFQGLNCNLRRQHQSVFGCYAEKLPYTMTGPTCHILYINIRATGPNRYAVITWKKKTEPKLRKKILKLRSNTIPKKLKKRLFYKLVLLSTSNWISGTNIAIQTHCTILPRKNAWKRKTISDGNLGLLHLIVNVIDR